MNETVDKFLLVDDKFMPHMHLKQPGFTCAAVVHLPKNKELKHLCRQETQILLTETKLIKLVFDMMRLMANQKI